MEQPKPNFRTEREKKKRAKQAADRDFQVRIMELDGRLCCNPRCGASWYWQHAISAHHLIYKSDGGTNDDWNGITLCALCHRAAHRSRSWVLGLLQELKREHEAGRRKDFRWQNAIDNLLTKVGIE